MRSDLDGGSGLGLLVGVSGLRVSSMSTPEVAGSASECGGALRFEGESFEGKVQNVHFSGDLRGVMAGVLVGELFQGPLSGSVISEARIRC